MAFAQAPVGILVVDGAGLIREANPALCDLLGYAAGTLDGRALSVLGAVAQRSCIRRWLRADGTGLDLRIRPSPARGDFRVLIAEAVDADEVVRAEENRAALTAAGLGEWRYDFADGQVALSRRAAHILGFAPGAAVSWATMQAALEGGETGRIRAQVRASLRETKPFALECRLRRDSDGVAIDAEVRGQAILGPEGGRRPIAVVGVIEDVTTRVEARNALRDGEQRLRIATSLAALGIFEWHMLDDQAVWENERMFAIFGRRPSDGALGKREFLDAVLHPEDRPAFRAAITRALREDSVLEATGRIRRLSDGAWRILDFAGRFERDAPHRLPRRLIGVVADVTERRLAEERQTLLIRELHHRVKNTLATVQAIVGSTARTASSIESFYEAFVGRIMSLAHTHSVLTEDTWQTASLRSLLANELKPYAEGSLDGSADGDARIQLVGPPVDMSSEVAVPIGMAIHELTTNAAKYGALSTRDGRVSIAWALEPGGPAGTLRFSWVESGGPPVSPPTRQGFGSRLLQRVLTAQVRAEVTMTYPPEGFALTMLAPLPARNDALNPLA
ncbi:HWE histidine kinase domain-containing protein [Methylobacterium sp. J-068]|uniref:sensor histidine kinase n=1 Tax=Methylobacterium sp. J-068 TaxID=2836649 RepID=UPI001FBB316C|nr:HWE histidine kinase domain-containing protein [Methylobacterium sp. J-068]MCJ2035920.1 PAS domain S-box protein [Methylobacterium sp. J-068]